MDFFMKLHTAIWFFFVVTGLTYAQNNPVPADLNNPDHFLKGKNPFSKTMQLHPEYDVLLYHF